MKKTHYQYIFYVIFAVFSILLNCFTQIIFQFVFDRANFTILSQAIFGEITIGFCLKMLTATIVGFVFKFIVDKFIVFEQNSDSLSKSIKQVILYGSFAVVTTAIFWATEMFFKMAFKTQTAEIIGAVIGLTVGYTIKFIFDKNVVFR